MNPTTEADTLTAKAPRFRVSLVSWCGLVLFIVGSGPLIAVILAAKLGITRDPNPNPVRLGIIAFFTFWPSVAIIVIGLGKSLADYLAARARFRAVTAKEM